MTNTIRIGVLGLGTVGSGLLRVLARNHEEIERRVGVRLVITKAAVVNLLQQRQCDTATIELSTDALAICADPEIDLVVELIGGETLAKACIEQALQHGKPVVTANKSLLAKHGNELFAMARAAKLPLLYEAAVAGGIPIIKAIREALIGNKIAWIAGIINGTSNFILSAMQQQKITFADALGEAQCLGYAEASPALDLDGMDAAHKITLLAANAFGTDLNLHEVAITGISGITPDDINYARELGFVIKPLAIARNSEAGIAMRVGPALVPLDSPLAGISGANNAVLVQADAAGPTMYYGAGAGGEATASAVLADIADAVRLQGAPYTSLVPDLAFQTNAVHQPNYLSAASNDAPYYLRLRAKDSPGVLADITKVLGDAAISIDAILQKPDGIGDGYMPVIILTHQVREETLQQALVNLNAIAGIKDGVVQLPVELLGTAF